MMTIINDDFVELTNQFIESLGIECREWQIFKRERERGGDREFPKTVVHWTQFKNDPIKIFVFS